ncbi:MAG: tetratricopeptide repeat protein [Elusimicrobiota bacterium]
MEPLPRLVRSLLYILFGVCPILFFTDLTRNPYYTQIALMNVLIPGIALFGLIGAFRKKELVWAFTVLDRPLLILIGFSLFSWLASFAAHRSFLSAIYSEGSRGAIFLIVNTYLVYAIALRVQDRKLFRNLLWITYLVSVIASVYGMAQYFGVELIWPHNLNPYGSRPVSTFGNPNFMSSYLVLVIPVMIADLLFQTTGAPRVFLLAAVLCDVGALLATMTRSSWLGMLVGLVIVGLGLWPTLDAKRRVSIRKWGLVVALGIGLLVIFWPQGQSSNYRATVLTRLTEVKQMVHGRYASASQRFLIWTAAWGMVQDHPLIGKGWGCFELFYPFYQSQLLLEPAFQGYRTHANNAHNEIMEYWAQIGTIGLGLVLWLWVVFFRFNASLARRLPESWRAMAWGLIGGVAGMLVDNLLNVSVHFAVPALLFWWWVGSLFALDPSTVRTVRWDLSSFWRKAGVILAGVFLVCLIARSFCFWRQEINFFEGFKLSKGGTNLVSAQAALERAYAWHPLEVNNNYELGNVYARLNQKEKALVMYRRALDANAGYDEIYFNQGTMLMQLGRDPEAIANYRICLAINPLSHDAYNALATVYMKNIPRFGAETESLYQQGTRVFPLDKDLWNNLGYLYTQGQRWEPAYQAYFQALQVDPEFDLARRNIAAILKHLPPSTAEPFLRIEADFRDVERLMDGRRWNEALVRVRRLETALPRSYRAHFYAGNIFFSLKRLDEAAVEYEQAVALQPGGEGAWQNLGVTYDRLGQTDKADQVFRKVLQINPANQTVKARLGIQ